MFIIYIYQYTRALVEKYFCICHAGISGITWFLPEITEESTAEGIWEFGGWDETRMQYSSNEEGSLLHFLILCGENKYAAVGEWKRFIGKISSRL